MLDPQSLVKLNDAVVDDVRLQGLGMIVALHGHADAGDVVRQVRSELLDSLDHELVAAFDADQLLDYRERRPQITFLGDRFTAYQRPRIELYRLTDGLGTDFLLLTGPEPDLQWERFASAVVLVAAALNVTLTASFGGVPMPVPHTRQMGVTVHGNRPELREGISTWNPTAEIPAAAAHLIEMRLIEAGRDAVGYSLHVPHYLADGRYPQVAVSALEFLGAALGLGLPTDRLREAARRTGEEIDAQVADSPDIQKMVSAFEERFDEFVPAAGRRSLLLDEHDALPDAEDLADAVEAFLSTHGPEAAPGEGGQ
ncbi:PAC2 family protein [Zafaria sp. Z1313]|uniref:PAC2 family protein n=1 Tax=unclassified Zafaria TaxID=2828765 RepID=UPI002E7A09F8|nr:PAC2 family protein [Zafaria sp. J156]MEE1620254.1 PAC2 family protein [Zafaria sp. J156]